jgi:hypothetical protein
MDRQKQENNHASQVSERQTGFEHDSYDPIVPLDESAITNNLSFFVRGSLVNIAHPVKLHKARTALWFPSSAQASPSGTFEYPDACRERPELGLLGGQVRFVPDRYSQPPSSRSTGTTGGP